MTFQDIGRGQWILVDTFESLPNWKVVEAEAQEAYEMAFGADAPDEVREIGEMLVPRLVFG